MSKRTEIVLVIALFLLTFGIIVYWNDYYFPSDCEDCLDDEQRQWLKENYYPQKEKQLRCEAVYDKCLEEGI